MDDKVIQQESETALAEALRTLWEGAHGVPVSDSRVLVGPDSVAVWLEGVLSPAERASASGHAGGQLIQQYIERLLAIVQPDLLAHIESITGRRVVSSKVQADVKTDYMLCLFVLGEQLGTSIHEGSIHSHSD